MITHYPSYPTPYPFYCPRTWLGLVTYLLGEGSSCFCSLSQRTHFCSDPFPQRDMHIVPSRAREKCSTECPSAPSPSSCRGIHVIAMPSCSKWRQISMKGRDCGCMLDPPRRP